LSGNLLFSRHYCQEGLRTGGVFMDCSFGSIGDKTKPGQFPKSI
jgi:hypothetical protein